MSVAIDSSAATVLLKLSENPLKNATIGIFSQFCQLGLKCLPPVACERGSLQKHSTLGL